MSFPRIHQLVRISFPRIRQLVRISFLRIRQLVRISLLRIRQLVRISFLGALEEPNRERTGFLIMPKRPYEWRLHSHGCYKFDNATVGLGPRDQSAHLPVFLPLRTANLPGTQQYHA